MEIRDVIHGSIIIHPLELPIIDSRFFQRLRQIKQLGFAENAFPGATHNRYIHSLGALEAATQVFDKIFDQRLFLRFRAAVRLAALLHDIGHGPLSHTSEFAMPSVSSLNIPGLDLEGSPQRKATHEDYTLKILLDSELTPLLDRAGSPYGFKAVHIASLIEPKIRIEDSFFEEDGINFQPILKQIISSELDADRMDYLRRDSLHAGVSYGQFDIDWLLSNLTFHIENKKCYLGLHHRALYAFEDFLISRFHMFSMIYFHHKSVIFDEMLGQYLSSPECPYQLPSNIESYCLYDDAHLAAHLTQSPHPWAKRLIEKRPYRMLIELHSGIPATRTARLEQQRLLKQVEKDLSEQGIHFLKVTSTSELSKYFRRPGDPLFICYDNHYSAPSFIPLETCTDLFEKYSEKRSITRLYVSPEQYSLCRNQGRKTPLRYQEET